MKKTVLTYGLIAGIFVSAFMVVSMAFADHSNMVNAMLVGYSSMILAFSMIFVGVKNYRDKQNAGLISFGQALKLGLLIALVASTLYVITWAIDYHYFLPDFMDKFTAKSLENFKAEGHTPAEISAEAAKMAESNEMYKNPLFFVGITYAEILPVGIIISFITALVLMKSSKKAVV
ncbi:DUF4199 domain-containing protein [Hufsiella ginkgonis]|uniref:DUF4199 family protein n=1 Tax=Hufsiella ginkgonis TaxID=2695274 RepID=A0A7K1XYM9_9SPHI|nr:DUF4199 domain-containing protein [Hufsiella ginkgonis]MXV16101.1 DUF4199 family protein [Hufsiella ginkgonis]